MLSLTTITVAGLVIAAVLVWFFLRTRSADMIGEMMEKRRASSRIVSRADYVEGMEKIPVAIALTNDTFYYENPDLQASFDLNRIDEVEYTDELSTGKEVAHGCRAIRLRSRYETRDGQPVSFEFGAVPSPASAPAANPAAPAP